VSFSSSLSDRGFYAVDHRLDDEGIFPGAGFLEMACISGNIVNEQRVTRITDVVWMHPLSFRAGAQALQTVLRYAGDHVEYVITSIDDENETVVHSEGRLAFRNGTAGPLRVEEPMSLEALKAQCAQPEDGPACYDRFREYGLQYGPSFQTIQELYVNGSFALSKLAVADHLKGDFGQFILHPSMIDGALQTVAGLAGTFAPQTLCLPFALDEIDILKPLPQTCYAYAEWADGRPLHAGGVMKFNIRLLSERGDTLIRINNLYVRPLARPVTHSPSLAAAGAGAKGQLLRLSGERG
jgi:polyketide synthase PksL